MKRLLLTCGAAALLFSAGAAWADDEPVPVEIEAVMPDVDTTPAAVEPLGTTFLFATAQLEKDVTTNELINFTTLVNLDQLVDNTHATAFAESTATAKQTATNDTSATSAVDRTDTIAGAGLGNEGAVSTNQASGDQNNQGTIVSAAITNSGASTEAGFAHAQAEATQTNGAALVANPLDDGPALIPSPGNDVEAVNVAFRDALITGSFNHDIGLVFANQSVGNNNNQLNVLSLAFSDRPQGVAIAEADLGQFNTDNKVGESDGIQVDSTGTAVRVAGIGINKSATIDGSLIGILGIFGVNQEAGNNGNQANIVSVAAIGVGLPGF